MLNVQQNGKQGSRNSEVACRSIRRTHRFLNYKLYAASVAHTRQMTDLLQSSQAQQARLHQYKNALEVVDLAKDPLSAGHLARSTTLEGC
jgi:hypothetical protein